MIKLKRKQMEWNFFHRCSSTAAQHHITNCSLICLTWFIDVFYHLDHLQIDNTNNFKLHVNFLRIFFFFHRWIRISWKILLNSIKINFQLKRIVRSLETQTRDLRREEFTFFCTVKCLIWFFVSAAQFSCTQIYNMSSYYLTELTHLPSKNLSKLFLDLFTLELCLSTQN